MKYSVKLRILGGEIEEERFLELSEGQFFVLGRETESSMTDAKVSRKHCGFMVENGLLLVVDTGSRRGTYLNHLEITKNTVKESDVIRVGPYQIVIQEIQKDESPTAQMLPPLVQSTLGLLEATQITTLGGVQKIEDPKAFPHVNPSWWEKLPLHLREWLEASDLDYRALLEQLKMAFLQPSLFFDLAIFQGEVRTSLRVIAFCGFLLGFFNSRHLPQFAPILGALFSVVLYTLVSSVLHTIRYPIGIEGGFQNLMRFFAYVSIVAVPISFAGLLVPPLGLLFNLLWFAWSILGFYTVFKPRLVSILMIGTVGTAIFSAAWLYLIGAMISPEKLQNLTDTLKNMSASVKVSEFQTMPVQDVSASEVSVARTENRGFEAPAEVVPLEMQARAIEEPAQGKLSPKTFVGEFRKGEMFHYWFQLTGPGFKRVGALKIKVKAVNHEGARVAVEGQLDGLKSNFEQDVSWEMDFTSVRDSDLKVATIKDIMNTLFSYRVRMHLLEATPADLLPKTLRSPHKMKVAGIKAEYYQGWSPVRAVASVWPAFDIAVSKNYGLPLFLQGQNAQRNEHLYMTLKEYRMNVTKKRAH